MRTVIPVCFVTIIFLRVVRSSQDDTALATEVTDSERHFGSRTHIVEQIYFDTVGRENIGRGLRKQTAVVTAVMTDYYRNLWQVFEVLLQIVGKPLSGSTYRIDIHTIGAHSHDPAKTARTELEVLVKTLYKFFHIIIHQVFNLFFSLCIIIAVEPFLGFRQHLLF